MRTRLVAVLAAVPMVPGASTWSSTLAVAIIAIIGVACSWANFMGLSPVFGGSHSYAGA